MRGLWVLGRQSTLGAAQWEILEWDGMEGLDPPIVPIAQPG